MKYGQLILDRREYGLLMRSIADSKSQEDKIYRESLKKLKLELLTAKVVDDNAMPEDVIRFNSVVSISTPYNVTRSYQIVTPDKSDIKKNKIS
ncbi:MAG: transcription elongation factor GreAB, partial [Flavobacterium sp.]|nr:transcription elongation factor GreAB [Flavobacterium sp.]